MKLIVGLGNPGKQYEHSRHNAGETFVRKLAHQHAAPLKADSKYHGEASTIITSGKNLWLLVPTTFMNRSGHSVAALANFYKIAPADILVAHDDLDLAPGSGKFKFDGGSGGHNGLRDIITRLGNTTGFWRLRIGIGHPGTASQVTNWVLNKAPAAEFNATNALIDEALTTLPDFIGIDTRQQAIQYLHSFQPD